MKRLKNQKGFTLVEVVISMAITTIVVLAVANLFSSASGLITTLRADSNLDIACDATNTYVRNRLDALNDATVCSNTHPDIDDTADDYNQPGYEVFALAVIDGKLYDFGKLPDSNTGNTLISRMSAAQLPSYAVYDEAFYSGTKLNVRFTSANEDVTLDDGTTSSAVKWLRVESGFIASDANPANQPKAITFRLFNGAIALSESNVDISDNFVVIYRQKKLEI